MSAADIERLSRVLCVADGQDPDVCGPAPDDDTPQWRLYVSDVRTLLIGLREPSDKMVQAGADASNSCLTDAGDSWRVMIDTLLGET